MHCSKGSGTIAPIIPSGDYNQQPEVSDSIYFDSSDGRRDAHSNEHPQVTPVMDVKLLNEMNDELTSRIGSDRLPQDQLILLHAKPLSISETNPPTIRFAFAAPPDTISPDDISVILDGENISGYVKYSLASRNNRKADFYLGSYKPSGFMNPTIQHSLDISITPQLGNSLSKHVNFNVPQPRDFRITRIGFPMDNDTKEIYFNKLRVTVFLKDDVVFNRSVFDKTSWDITNKSETILPELVSIEPSGKDAFILNFAKNFESFAKLDISFSPADGIATENHEVLAPYIPKERGGDVYRKGATDCPPGCEGSLSPELIEREVEGCEDNHTWIIHADCPDPYTECYSQIRITKETTSYHFNNASEYYLTKTSSCEPGVVSWTIHPPDVTYPDCRSSLNEQVDSSKDVEADYVIIGHNGYPDPGPCGEVSNHSIVRITSDRTCPIIESALFRPDDDTAPDCETQCCEMVKYQLVIRATDDKCLNDGLTYLIVFYNDGSHRYVNPQFISGEMYNNNKSMTQIFEFDSPNIFACATKLKVIVHDKKGNWNSHPILPQEIGAIEINYARLMYPHTLELSFGERPNPNPEVPNDQRQYVNLERHYTYEIAQDVCVRKIDYPDHGSKIYLEISTIPPFYGISFDLHYEDPKFSRLKNHSPTNTINIDNPDTTTYSSSNNPDLIQPNNHAYYLLWGEHEPYGEDNVELGDNYNYFHKWPCGGLSFQQYCIANNVPEYDPIRTRTNKPTIFPYFEKPDCTGIEEHGLSCEDYYTSTPFISLHTHIQGKAAVYFDTLSHGGDNFSFRATTKNDYYGLDLNNCLSSEPNEIITVCRKAEVDFAYMTDRGDSFPCLFQREHRGNHDIPWPFEYISDGVFDDCFIELEWKNRFPDTEYRATLALSNGVLPALPDIYQYVHSYTPFDYRKDALLLVGIDHLIHFCLKDFSGGDPIGCTTPVDMQYPEFLSFVCVGHIDDFFKQRKHVPYKIDFKDVEIMYEDYEYVVVSAHTAAHELAHNLHHGADFSLDNWRSYGLMNYYDKRWYLHHDVIIELRKHTPYLDWNCY